MSGAVFNLILGLRYQSVLGCVPKCPDFARPVECPGAKCPIFAKFRAEFRAEFRWIRSGQIKANRAGTRTSQADDDPDSGQRAGVTADDLEDPGMSTAANASGS